MLMRRSQVGLEAKNPALGYSWKVTFSYTSNQFTGDVKYATFRVSSGICTKSGTTSDGFHRLIQKLFLTHSKYSGSSAGDTIVGIDLNCYFVSLQLQFIVALLYCEV